MYCNNNELLFKYYLMTINVSIIFYIVKISHIKNHCKKNCVLFCKMTCFYNILSY